MSLDCLPGVGPATLAKLHAEGIHSLEDLAMLLPIHYEDRRVRPADFRENERMTVKAQVLKFRSFYLRRRFFAVMDLVSEDSHQQKIVWVARWFHPLGGLQKRAQTGCLLLLSGKMQHHRGVWTMIHPHIADPAQPGPNIAIEYPEVAGLGAQKVASLCRSAVEQIVNSRDPYEDALPQEVRQRFHFPLWREALQMLHCPDEQTPIDCLAKLQTQTSSAHRRFMFEELLCLQIERRLQRNRWKEHLCTIQTFADEAGSRERLRATIPFEPTLGQWQAIQEIEMDLARPTPMIRLLQGDVGSGKTLVAFAACVGIVSAGGQVAFMVPTEVLAHQHMQTLTPWCEQVGIRLHMLSGSTTAKQRSECLQLLAKGQIDVLMGTHALLTEDVQFAQLGLVIIDEQHRFGVEQRALLHAKFMQRALGAEKTRLPVPHLLVMTATPIPRTLALAAYGELDLSVIEGMPPGRKPAQTVLLAGQGSLARARKKFCQLIGQQKQGFVVCPRIEGEASDSDSNVEETFRVLSKLLGKGQIAMLHGRMNSQEKQRVMGQFRDGILRVLVTTTVVEVGVDVPTAQIILIEHAERFGLAQLHQLRGRVGRGLEPSVCLLQTNQKSTSEPALRLQALVDHSDGFAIALRDLQSRGPGSLFGTQQAGSGGNQWHTLLDADEELLVVARRMADEIVEQDQKLRKHSWVARKLAFYRRRWNSVVFGEAG